ncbi:hypothetical protein CRI94_07810 [Longibacter salinarum]|uniref:Uncharacterized protein n=1 Tax=Longibacter salinarum TaxID=1850348 RepID=A0A2A8CZ93_9BACT|nr:hypothetical protein [Longibacter salinarum]PEN13950.1 hypothetical protein CRI94_07810 [Longibacter salinarum]
MPDHTDVSREVSLSSRLFWLGAALWIVAAKTLVVVTWTPVEIVSPRVRLLAYGLALGLPCVPLVLVAARSAVFGQWRRGLIASAILGVLLTFVTASGITSAALRAAHSWETHQVLYRHRDEADRTIETQRRVSDAKGEYRTVQTRPITSFLSYTEPIVGDPSRRNWVSVSPDKP